MVLKNDLENPKALFENTFYLLESQLNLSILKYVLHYIQEGMPKSYVKFEDFRWHAPFLIIFQVFLLPQSPYYHASEHLLLASYYTYSSYLLYCTVWRFFFNFQLYAPYDPISFKSFR